LMIKLNRNVVSVYLCLDNGHFITVINKINSEKKPLIGAVFKLEKVFKNGSKKLVKE
jgi:hypothetical protein